MPQPERGLQAELILLIAGHACSEQGLPMETGHMHVELITWVTGQLGHAPAQRRDFRQDKLHCLSQD